MTHGEVFCRVARCDNGQVPASATNNLRAHLRRHGLVLAKAPSGRLTQAHKDQAIAWYNALFDEEEEEGDDQE
ncbi:unnamed protein product [Penicillium bialowiezense]